MQSWPAVQLPQVLLLHWQAWPSPAVPGVKQAPKIGPQTVPVPHSAGYMLQSGKQAELPVVLLLIRPQTWPEAQVPEVVQSVRQY